MSRRRRSLQQRMRPALTVSTANLLWEQSESVASHIPRDERRQQLEEHCRSTDLSEEFGRIPTKSTHSRCLVGRLPHNIGRNRDTEILPYDHNRFTLSATAENPDGYYNASVIQVSTLKEDSLLYIGAQSPRADTKCDFWRLVWESGAKIVVQLCSDEACTSYYPAAVGPSNRMLCDKAYEVQLLNATTSPDTEYSIMALELFELASSRRKKIWLFCYPRWTDRLIPHSVTQFLMFLDEVDSLRRLFLSEDEIRTPVLAHCPNGSGQVGLALCLQVYKACLQHNQSVSLSTVLCSLRGQRMQLVQSLEQYTFIYEALIESLDSTRLI